MTVKEKAKAYDEAINQAKKELQICGSLNCDAARQIFRLFPKLAESEDERIRKALVKYFEERNNYRDKDETFNGISFSAIIAYLEKQKESTWTEEDESFRKNILPRILNPTGWTLEQIKADRGPLKEFVERQKNKWVEKQKEHQFCSDAPKEKSVGGDFLSSHKDKNLDEIAQDYVDGVKEYNPEPTWDLMQTAVCYGYHYREGEEQKPVEGITQDEIEQAMKTLTDFKVFAAKEAEQYNIGHRRDIDWHNFCASLLTYLEVNKPVEWKPQPESLEALMYAIEGKWDMIPPTSYLSHRLEDLYEGLVNTYHVDESLITELHKVASEEDIEALVELKRKIDASMDKKSEERFEEAREKYQVEWSEEDKENLLCVCGLLKHYLSANYKGSKYWDDAQVDELLEWTKNLPNRFQIQPKQEWSEEDEAFLKVAIAICNRYSHKYIANWLKSLRPQPKQEIYLAAKHDLAIKFMNYLDENRPEGKMGLSNAECKDIDKSFKENDWAKIIKYYEKYGRRD